MGQTVVVKLSGKALAAESALTSLFKASVGKRLVVVHGGGVEVDSLFKALGLEVVKKDGLRVSPKEQMPFICAALAGMCNKSLQSLAVKSGSNAVGMLASDGHTLKVSKLKDDLGMVGTVEANDPSYLDLLLNHGYTPIIASIAMDETGELYNVNADDVAAAVAKLLEAPLYYISDVKGVLDGDGRLIESLDRAEAKKLIENGTINGGMAVKVKSALKVSAMLNQPVYIASYQDPNLSESLFCRRALGTEFLG